MKKKEVQPFISPKNNWQEMLEARLLQNRAATIERNPQTKEIRILVPTKRPGYLFPPISWIVRPPEYRISELDPIGTLVWDLCDGKNTVRDIIIFFSKKYGLTFHESRVSVTNYLKLLIGRGALAVTL